MPSSPDWYEAYLAAIADDEDPGDPDLYQDPSSTTVSIVPAWTAEGQESHSYAAPGISLRR